MIPIITEISLFYIVAIIIAIFKDKTLKQFLIRLFIVTPIAYGICYLMLHTILGY